MGETLQTKFSKAFLEWKLLWLNKQYSSIASDNDLVPVRRQAMILINDGLRYWRIYALFGLGELSLIVQQSQTMYLVFDHYFHL